MKFLPNTIINFHAIYDNAWMEKIFVLLKRQYNIVPISEIEKFYYHGHKLRNVCHITFDDGDSSFYIKVFPLLKKHQIPVSIFVSPKAASEQINFWFQEIRDYDSSTIMDILHNGNFMGHPTPQGPSVYAALKDMTLDNIWRVIDKYQKMTNTPPKPCMNMTPSQLIELKNSMLVNIGAHTLNHPILKNENNETATHEIKTSIDELGNLLNTKIKYFAYPNGFPNLDFGTREIEILKKCGIALSFSTEKKSFSKGDNPLSIPRNGLSYGNKTFVMMKLVAGDKWYIIKRLLKGKQENDYREAVGI